MRWLRASRSLLLTGAADAWAAWRRPAAGTSEASGLALMVLSAAAFALMAAVAKKLLPDTPSQTVVFSRGVIMTAVFFAAARMQGVSLVGRRPKLLFLRGALGYGALSCYFYSVQILPLGDAVLLQYSHPVFVAALAPLLLGEPNTKGQWWLILTAVLGVALVVHPSGSFHSKALVGVLGSMFSAIAYVSVRTLARTEHPMTIMFWFPLASLPLSLVGTLDAGREALPRDGSEVAGHLLVALTALVGQTALTHGLARAGAARATAVTLTGPVFGIALGHLLFDTVPPATSLVGTAIVLTAIGLLGARRAEDAPVRGAEVRSRSG